MQLLIHTLTSTAVSKQTATEVRAQMSEYTPRLMMDVIAYSWPNLRVSKRGPLDLVW